MTDDVTMAFPSYHALTGCDSVSISANKKKLSGFTLLKKELQHKEAYQVPGQSHDVPEGTNIVVEDFICHLYGMKVTSVSERYIYCIMLKEEKLDPIYYLQVKHVLSGTH